MGPQDVRMTKTFPFSLDQVIKNVSPPALLNLLVTMHIIIFEP